MIAVIGAGAFGTGLAVSLAQNGPVTLWCHDPQHAEDMANSRENRRRLPGVPLPEELTITAKMDDVSGANTALLAVPMQKLRDFLCVHGTSLSSLDLVACCKGIELSTGKRPTEVIADLLPDNTRAVLTGPSFASDIARGLPTALTLACADETKCFQLQKDLTTPNIRTYRTLDVIGAELGGALKNVIAIACGAAIGAGLGESARAALMTRGFAEIIRVAETKGAQPETLGGLSGFGDLALTCGSTQSRNFHYGESLGRGAVFETGVTVEGAATALAMADEAAPKGLDLPITNTVAHLVKGDLKVVDAIEMLLSRPLKEE
ncbi:MAG: NAD(P)H-dependent glycerol-3-phosphate dehydrogenase [Pseudomonadota bacterium]